MYEPNMQQPETNPIVPEVNDSPVSEKKEVSRSELIYRSWFSKFFMKDFGKLEKRLLDWWTAEGFFGITNIVPTEDGETIDFLLRVGRTAYDEMSNETAEYLAEKTEKVVNVKKRQGWDVYSSKDVPSLHVLYKSQKNIDKIQQMLMANIRSFKIEKFDYQTLEGVEYIRSLTVRIYKKRAQ